MNKESLLDTIQGRRSIRKFSSKPVGKDMIDDLIKAASWAPSAGNRQDWFFTVITSSEMKKKMAETVKEKWSFIIQSNRDIGFIEEIEHYSASFSDFADAPVVVIVSSTIVNATQKHLLGDDAFVTGGSATSAAMAAENLMLRAHDLGLGTCCMTGALAARKELGKITGLGRKLEIVCLITLGFPDEQPAAPLRKPIEEIMRLIK